MRKKDYELIASGLYAAKLGAKTVEERFGVRLAVDNVLTNLQNENPRFDTQKFLTACGIATQHTHDWQTFKQGWKCAICSDTLDV